MKSVSWILGRNIMLKNVRNVCPRPNRLNPFSTFKACVLRFLWITREQLCYVALTGEWQFGAARDTHVWVFITLESLGCTPCLGISETVLSLELEEVCSVLCLLWEKGKELS